MNIEKIFNGYKSEYKEEILIIINDNFSDKGLDSLISFLEDDINYNGAVDDMIDDYIDIYYRSLREWAVNNYHYIEDALVEFGTSEDYHKDIQMGQYKFYSEEIYSCINEMIKYIKDNYKV